jgi:hypothetical protein
MRRNEWQALVSFEKPFMPAKPVWYGKLDSVIATLQGLPRHTVDSATVEFLLGVGRRRAQQIMAPAVVERIGASGLADRDQLIAALQRAARGEEAYYERQRRRKLAGALEHMRRARRERPQVWIEAPAAIVKQNLEALPAAVQLEPGRITVEFADPGEALEKLLALAMAIGNDRDAFERATRKWPPFPEGQRTAGISLPPGG